MWELANKRLDIMGQAVFKWIQFLCDYFGCKLAGQPGPKAGPPTQQTATDFCAVWGREMGWLLHSPTRNTASSCPRDLQTVFTTHGFLLIYLKKPWCVHLAPFRQSSLRRPSSPRKRGRFPSVLSPDEHILHLTWSAALRFSHGILICIIFG